MSKNNYPFVSDVKLRDFQPTLLWPAEYEVTCPRRRLVLDPKTNQLYINDDRFEVRIKFLLLIVGVSIFHTMLAILQIIVSCFKLFKDLIKVLIGGYNNITKNFYDLFEDLCKIIIVPLLVAALEITAMIGLIFPLNSRKIFASIERLMVNSFEVHNYYNNEFSVFKNNKFILAACFQPKSNTTENNENNFLVFG